MQVLVIEKVLVKLPCPPQQKYIKIENTLKRLSLIDVSDITIS